MELAVQAFKPGYDIQHAVSLFLTFDQQRAEGIKGAVKFPLFFLNFDSRGGVFVLIFGFEHAVDVGPAEAVFTVIRDYDMRAGIADVNLRAVGVPIFPGVVGLVDTVEHQCRSNGAGNVNAIEDQGNFGIFIGKGIVLITQVDPDLPLPGAGEFIGTGLSDMQNRVLPCFRFGMHHGCRDIVAADRQIRPDIFTIFFHRIVIDPFHLVIIKHHLVPLRRNFRVIKDVMGDINRILTGGFGSGVVFRGGIFHFIMDYARVCMPGVIIFGHGSAVQRSCVIGKRNRVNAVISANRDCGAQ